jgi:anti-sigma regulatory factor (Ser/Thr protein kinase)
MLKTIHGTVVPAGKLPPIKDTFLGSVRRTKAYLPEKLGEKLVSLTEAIPDDDHMIHGDFHTKNIVLAGDEVLVIDMDTLSVGHPVFDFLRMYNAYIGYSENDPDVVLRFQGFTQETANRFWHDSLALYLGTNDEQKIKEVEDKVRCLAYGYLVDWGVRHHADEALISLWKSRLIELLPRIDDLTFEVKTQDNSDPNELEIEATAENLQSVLDFIGSRLDAVECPMKSRMQLDLAVEEIFVNIANYAYAPSIGKATVRVEVSDNPITVTITFVDRGVPYDPLKKADPDVTLSAAERQIGGLGIFLTKKIMDDVSYEYRDGQNVLTLKKAL